jgi:hypothetical protein
MNAPSTVNMKKLVNIMYLYQVFAILAISTRPAFSEYLVIVDMSTIKRVNIATDNIFEIVLKLLSYFCTF